MIGELTKYDPVTRCGIVPVTRNKQAIVPVVMCILFNEKCRQQIDEFFAVAIAEVSPYGHVATIAVVMGELPGTRIYRDDQGDAAACQQVGKGLHVLQGARDTALWSSGGKTELPQLSSERVQSVL
jgi:hypothetical protein